MTTGHGREPLVGPELPEHLEAIDSGHHDVEQEQPGPVGVTPGGVGAAGEQEVEGLGAVLDPHEVVGDVLAAQRPHAQVRVGRLVFGEQDLDRLGRAGVVAVGHGVSPISVEAAGRAAAAEGRAKEKHAPSPTRPSAQVRPPWRWMIRRDVGQADAGAVEFVLACAAVERRRTACRHNPCRSRRRCRGRGRWLPRRRHWDSTLTAASGRLALNLTALPIRCSQTFRISAGSPMASASWPTSIAGQGPAWPWRRPAATDSASAVMSTGTRWGSSRPAAASASRPSMRWPIRSA